MQQSPSVATASDSSPQGEPSWQDIHRHAQTLSDSLRSFAPSQSSALLSACLAYADLVDEIVTLAAAPERVARHTCRLPLLATPKQLQDFGRLLRDKRNQAGLSRVQLARKAKLSDATVKFLETARHPPSRATLLRLVGVPELGLRWSETPGADSQTTPSVLEETDRTETAAALHRCDSRLTVPMVLELMLVLEELRSNQTLVEITTQGARRACCLCGMRSERWAVDAGEAAKLLLRHSVVCAGRLADSLCQRHPVIAELAAQERCSRRSPTAIEIESCRQSIPLERFHGCRSGREVAAWLARVAALPFTAYRKGVRDVLLWALGVGPCPVEPTTAAFSERRAEQLAVQQPALSAAAPEDARLFGTADGARWLISPDVPAPIDSDSLSSDPHLSTPDSVEHPDVHT